MARGELRIYLGAAPGVGKTFAMLDEGCRRRERGTDVVIGYVETHGRENTAAKQGDLEIVPRRSYEYRGTVLEDLDLDAVLARHPQVALIDELAHTNAPGCRHEKRWQDVEELLAAGIDVISTVNIQHLESINDVVERITGVKQRETIPDHIVRAADQVELVDMTPEALRRRMAHGNVYRPEKIDAALANYFRGGNLAALRELALLWVADQVDVALEDYRERHAITEPWETRERVVVALTGAPGTEHLIRRAGRIAQRTHGDLLGVYVSAEEGLAGRPAGLLEQHRKLLEEVGGDYREVGGGDVAAALVDFARAENATQLVLGASQRSKWAELLRGSVINRVVRMSGPIDVHVISQTRDASGELAVGSRRRHSVSALPPRRQAVAWALAAAGVPALTLTLAQVRESTGLSTVLLLYLTLVVVVAAVGGTAPALVAAVGAFLAANWFFTAPIHRFSIGERQNVLGLAVFLMVAVIVSRFVDAAARRAAEAVRARGEAAALARLAASMTEPDPLPTLLEHLREVFALQSATLLRRAPDGGWVVEASAGEPVPRQPSEADVTEALSADVVLALAGSRIDAADRSVLNAFAAQLGVALERGRLRVEAGRARALAEANALRTALLQAVSHDLRTPLASIKASATSLRQGDVEWSKEDTEEFVRTIDEETDRLTALVGNLLDMSRIQAGVLQPALRPVALEEVVPAAVHGLGARAEQVDVHVSEDLPPVLADAALLERAVANVVENAARASAPDGSVRIEAGVFNGRVDLRVVDRGPGIARAQRDQVFEPFQRLGDAHEGNGVGLGLAVARGFMDAMGGTIEIDDTPGGGTTVVLTLPAAS
jgi:two-component system sensor histidine kinase KdpD